MWEAASQEVQLCIQSPHRGWFQPTVANSIGAARGRHGTALCHATVLSLTQWSHSATGQAEHTCQQHPKAPELKLPQLFPLLPEVTAQEEQEIQKKLSYCSPRQGRGRLQHSWRSYLGYSNYWLHVYWIMSNENIMSSATPQRAFDQQ